jgi:hypothetical protein
VSTIHLIVTVEIDGDRADDAARKVDELLPDRNGLVAGGIAAVIVRRLCACGLAGGYPAGWQIANVEVRQ